MKTFIAALKDDVRDTFLTGRNMELLKSFGEVREAEGELTVESIRKSIGDAEVYMTVWGSPRLDREILDAAPNLRLLVHLCGSVAPFVSDALYDRGVRVISGNPYFAESTAEGALAYMFAAQREIPRYSTDLQKKKAWRDQNAYSRSVLGKTVGIVSYGAVAKNLVRMLKPFRVRLLIYDIVPIPASDREEYGIEQVSLERIFSEADIISIHTPLNTETRHMIGRDLLEKIKPDALLVNAARGAIIDQTALEEILAEGRFRAALDVYEKEPIPEDCLFYNEDNVLMMPHMAGPTEDLREEIALKMITESHEFIDLGKPLRTEISRQAAARMTEK